MVRFSSFNSKPKHLPKLGEPIRRSTKTSQIAPERHHHPRRRFGTCSYNWSIGSTGDQAEFEVPVGSCRGGAPLLCSTRRFPPEALNLGFLPPLLRHLRFAIHDDPAIFFRIGHSIQVPLQTADEPSS